MPFDLLHIVYLLLRFSCCFSKKTCYFFGVFPSRNQNFRPYFLRALQTRRIFSAISVPCAIFFALFEQIFLRFVRSFLSSVFRLRALLVILLFYLQKSSLSTFFTKENFTQSKQFSCKYKGLFDVQIFLRLFSFTTMPIRSKQEREKRRFLYPFVLLLSVCPYCGFYNAVPFFGTKSLLISTPSNVSSLSLRSMPPPYPVRLPFIPTTR